MSSRHVFCVLLLSILSQPGQAGSRQLASRLFQRLTGYSLPLGTPARTEMESLISSGNFTGAAAVATEEPSFINVTVREWAMPMSNRDADARMPLNDFVATVMGAVRDGLDARKLLIEDMVYVVNVLHPEIASLNLAVWNPAAPKSHFQSVDNTRIDVGKYLTAKKQQYVIQNVGSPPSFTAHSLDGAAAGLLTTHSWAEAHLLGGTNRRAIAHAFKEFLCQSIESLASKADTSIPDDRVHRDVDRSPGGLSATYQTSCRKCHAGMDALAGAYAHYDYLNRLYYNAAVVRGKYNQNGTFSPTYLTTDSSWKNYWTQNQYASLGWSASIPLQGTGVRTLGTMLANSDAFAACMARRTFRALCGPYALTPAILSTIDELKTDFKANGYKLKRLFEQTAAHKNCLGR